MRNAELEMRNGGAVQKMKSTAEYKDGAGKGRIPFSIGQRISLWYNSNRKGAKRQRMAP